MTRKPASAALRWSTHRFIGLLVKECREISRDRSTFMIGLCLPIFMLFIYGWGMSMDMTSVPIAVVLEESTPSARSLALDLEANRYFDARMHRSLASAEAALSDRSVECILVVPSDFERRAASGDASLGLALYGVDANSALIFRNYVEGVVRTWLAKRSALTGGSAAQASTRPVVSLTTRHWFNEASIIAGSLLGAMAVAREWERGTMPALRALSASAAEILLAKGLPLWGIVFAGDLLCLAAAQLVFGVPVRGSIPLLLAVLALFGAWSIILGLFVSVKTKSQFLASEAAVILSFMPTLMLSGFLFDLRSVPAWIEAIGRVLPPTHAIEALRIVFLSGGSPSRVAVNVALLACWTLEVFALSVKTLAGKPRATPLADADPKGKEELR